MQMHIEAVSQVHDEHLDEIEEHSVDQKCREPEKSAPIEAHPDIRQAQCRLVLHA
jgi:hypothetical protein